MPRSNIRSHCSQGRVVDGPGAECGGAPELSESEALVACLGHELSPVLLAGRDPRRPEKLANRVRKGFRVACDRATDVSARSGVVESDDGTRSSGGEQRRTSSLVPATSTTEAVANQNGNSSSVGGVHSTIPRWPRSKARRSH